MLIPALLLAAAQAHLPPAQQGVRRDVARDSTPYARSILEEAGDGLEARPYELDLVPQGPLPLQVRTLNPGATGTQNVGGGATTTPLPLFYEVTISPGTGFAEQFLFQEVPALGPRPLLVVFHKFGVSHYDAALHTTFFEEARKRGWFCMAPRSASQTHFSSLLSQTHTQAALDWASANFQVDPKRVYAVGFSMGGGAALNYAARHLDPNGVMFAAVFNISGIVSLEDTYVQEPGAQGFFDTWFGTGAPGTAQPFPMQRSSVLSFARPSLVVDPNTNLARNLMHLTTRSAVGTGDIPYLFTQNDVLHDHFAALGATPGQHELTIYNTPPIFHSWDLVPEKSVCDWMRTKRLQLPTAASTLADHDARYFYFDVVQAAAGAFTPFNWSVASGSNSVSVVATRNLQRITVDTDAAGLDANQVMTVTSGTADGQSDDVRLLGWSSAPIDVRRDGVSTSSWSYDAANDSVLLLGTDGGTHVWSLFP